ncbi:energy transducer TonB [Ideonella sp.]|uniref:energy transducer TonB n=1 Tax=Ideonella sp. TaxID=1929293 RepID=UPI003BB7BF27
MTLAARPSPASPAWPARGGRARGWWGGGAAVLLHAVLLAAWPGTALRPHGADLDRAASPAMVWLNVPAESPAVAAVVTPVAPAARAERAPRSDASAHATSTVGTAPLAAAVHGQRTDAPATGSASSLSLAALSPAAGPVPAATNDAASAPVPSIATASSHLAQAPAAARGISRAPQPAPGNALPAYPEAAREDGLEGQVRLRVEVAANGDVQQVSWAERSGVAVLDAAARDTVRRWRFAPALRDGEPVAGSLLLTLYFRLAGPVTWLAQASAAL